MQAPGRKLTLQRINHFVFPSPENIMENILGVTSFLREKIAAQGGDPDRETLTVVPTVEGKSFARDEAGNYWRCTVYVDGAASHESVQDLSMLEEAGRAFGRFQQLLCDYPADTLHEIIPDFHNTPAGTGSWSRPRRKTPPAAWERWARSWTSPGPESRTAPCSWTCWPRGSCPCG